MELERRHESQRPKRLLGAQKSKYINLRQDIRPATKQDCLGRADAMTLAELMAGAYPNLEPTRKRTAAADDEHQKKLSTLKVTLCDGRKGSPAT